MAYDSPNQQTYTLPASGIATAGVKLKVTGPVGMQGRLVSTTAVITTDTTVAPSIVQIGDSGVAAKFGTLSVPVGAADVVANNATISTSDSNLMPADTPVYIASDGGSTAGAADLAITIAWF